VTVVSMAKRIVVIASLLIIAAMEVYANSPTQRDTVWMDIVATPAVLCTKLAAVDVAKLTGKVQIRLENNEDTRSDLDFSCLEMYLPNTRSLVVSGLRTEQLASFFEHVSRLPCLRSLSIGDNAITDIPIQATLLTGVELFQCQSLSLTSIPRFLLDLPNVSDLNFNDCGLMHLPVVEQSKYYGINLHCYNNPVTGNIKLIDSLKKYHGVVLSINRDSVHTPITKATRDSIRKVVHERNRSLSVLQRAERGMFDSVIVDTREYQMSVPYTLNTISFYNTIKSIIACPPVRNIERSILLSKDAMVVKSYLRGSITTIHVVDGRVYVDGVERIKNPFAHRLAIRMQQLVSGCPPKW